MPGSGGPHHILLVYPAVPPDRYGRFKYAQRGYPPAPNLGRTPVPRVEFLDLKAYEHTPELASNGVEPIAAAWRWVAAAIAEAQACIEKIHVDFRTDVVYHYEKIARRNRGLFAPFAAELNRHGIDTSPQSS